MTDDDQDSPLLPTSPSPLPMAPNTQPQPNVASGARPVAETLRQLLAHAFVELAKDAQSPGGYLVEEAFSMWGQDVVASIKEYLVEHQNIPVVVNYPQQGKEALSLPQVCVVTQEENEGQAFLGDQTGMIGMGVYDQTDPDTDVVTTIQPGDITQRRQLGFMVSCRTDLIVRTEDPSICVWLTYLVRLIVMINKRQLIADVDVHNLKINLPGPVSFEGPPLFPEAAYTKAVSLSYDTNFDYNLRVSTLKRLNLSLLVNPAQVNPPDGSLHDENAVPVPPPEG